MQFRRHNEPRRCLASPKAATPDKQTPPRAQSFASWFSSAGAALVLVLALVCGCTTTHPPAVAPYRTFDFQKDTFSFPNELIWTYQYDTNGNWTTHRRDPRPNYAQHCFVLARSARQFFLNARFDASQPTADEATYRLLIRRVVSSNPRKALPEMEKIVIPGYSDLRSFSRQQEELLKAGCGGGWQSYFQRGHWRMIFPFSRRHQATMAQQLLDDLERDPPLIVHLVRFPQLTINHAVVIFGSSQNEKEICFRAYDPNHTTQPSVITYDRTSRTFFLTANDYFPGGRVDVYEVYYNWDH